ncbi:hypothetical protein [Sphingomonas gilva]|uniref:hypothetical protein n=1 Tax=Sphingomonas gilva TaxID=2305907 RepID=UPI001CA433E4|nr:hypothetical protein [Sphingomonas gilva]
MNWYLLIHVTVGVITATFIRSDPFDFAAKALFPAASILIGVSLAWSTRAATILQTGDLRAALFNDDRPPEDYVYAFQLSILVIIIMLAYVSVMAGGGVEITVLGRDTDNRISGVILYTLLSLSLRECWGVVNFTNMLSLLEYLRTKREKE